MAPKDKPHVPACKDEVTGKCDWEKVLQAWVKKREENLNGPQPFHEVTDKNQLTSHFKHVSKKKGEKKPVRKPGRTLQEKADEEQGM